MKKNNSSSNPDRTARIALMHWLLNLPEGANQARAAQAMVRHIDALDAEQTPATVDAFRQLLHQVANTVATSGRNPTH